MLRDEVTTSMEAFAQTHKAKVGQTAFKENNTNPRVYGRLIFPYEIEGQVGGLLSDLNRHEKVVSADFHPNHSVYEKSAIITKSEIGELNILKASEPKRIIDNKSIAGSSVESLQSKVSRRLARRERV